MSTEKTQSVVEIFEAIKNEMGFKKDIELAEFIGIGKSVLSGWKIRNSIGDYKKFTDKGFIEYFMRTGRGPMRINETPEEHLVRTYGKNPIVKSVRAGWKNELPNSQTQTSEPSQRAEEQPKRMQAEEFTAKCGFLLDFFNDTYEGDYYAIDGFLGKMRNEYLKTDPDYRRWTYNKEAEAEERRKKVGGEGVADGSLESKSANGS